MYGGKVLKQGLELFSSFASGSNDAAVLHAPFICSRTPTTAAGLNRSASFLTHNIDVLSLLLRPCAQ